MSPDPRVRAISLALAVFASTMAGCGGDTNRDGTGADSARATLAPPPPAALETRMHEADRASIAALPAGAGRDVVIASCLTCHSAAMLQQQHKDSVGWDKTITQMTTWGAPLTSAQQPVLLGYLVAHYGARVDAPVATTRR
ncbi:MAG: hypothetical protein ABI601_11460 [bacterium]